VVASQDECCKLCEEKAVKACTFISKEVAIAWGYKPEDASPYCHICPQGHEQWPAANSASLTLEP
jgi:hypothetical protein